ncbi:MAG: GNAT family N-acetyltransferase [Acidobacteria bacterium]|nr:GNAT family N-acetyltransferase [Acidobacteriota bacterium]
MSERDQLTTRIIRDEGAWDAIRPEWDSLYALSPSPAPPLAFAWMRRWWRVYGAMYGPGGLRVLTVWRGTILVAVLPLYLHSGNIRQLAVRSLRFISTGEAEEEEVCPEYLGLLCLPGDEAACHAAVWAEIGRLAWDQLELLDLSAESPLLQAGALPPNAQVFSRGPSYVADLTGGFEAYVARLSSRNRKAVRHLLRDGERADARLEIVGPDQSAGAFDDLRRLHQERWAGEGSPGAFSARRFIEFHSGLVQEWVPDGRAILARLWLAEEPVAVLYGFVSSRTFHFYQSGVRLDGGGRVESPGILAILLLMQALADRGVTALDFLRGPATHKTRMATLEHPIVGVRIQRPTVRGIAHRVVQRAGRIVKSRFRVQTGVRA